MEMTEPPYGETWVTMHGLRWWRPEAGISVSHRHRYPLEVIVYRKGVDALLQAALVHCADVWGHPVRCDRVQPYSKVRDPRYQGLRVARLRRFVVAPVRYIDTPHGPEPFGYQLDLDGALIELDDAGVPDPIKLRRAGAVEAWLGGPFDVVCGDHPRGPVAEGDSGADRYERFPERSIYIPELRAWPREGGAYVTRHLRRGGPRDVHSHPDPA